MTGGPRNFEPGRWLVAPEASRRRALELAGDIAVRLQGAAAASDGSLEFDAEDGATMRRRLLRLTWLTAPARRLTVLLDPLAAELAWELSCERIPVLSRREDIANFGLPDLDDLIAVLGDDEAWAGGDLRFGDDSA